MTGFKSSLRLKVIEACKRSGRGCKPRPGIDDALKKSVVSMKSVVRSLDAARRCEDLQRSEVLAALHSSRLLRVELIGVVNSPERQE